MCSQMLYTRENTQTLDPTYGSSLLQQFLHPNTPPHILPLSLVTPLPSPPLPRLTSSPLPGPSSPPVWGRPTVSAPLLHPSPPETGRPAHWCNNGEGERGWHPAKRIALFSTSHYLIYSADISRNTLLSLYVLTLPSLLQGRV